MKTLISNKRITNLIGIQWPIVFLICLLVRLPYLFGPHCYFDGDEAILGIMAQDLLDGKNIPIYFYGQQYGFSFFEVIGVSIGILFFGNTVWALKIGSLLIFSIGATFIFRLFIKKGISFWWTLIAILVIAFFPTWIVWAAKARGGYVTAFSLACIVLYITQLKLINFKWTIVVSFLMALMMHSQIFITCSISFLALIWILKSKSIKLICIASITFIVFYFLLKLPAFLNDNYWGLPISFICHYNSIIPFIRAIPKVSLGYFYYEMTFPPGMASKVFGVGYFLIVIIFIQLLDGSLTFKRNAILLSIGAVCSFLLIMFMNFASYRYFLGFQTAFLFILVLALIELLKQKSPKRWFLILILPFCMGVSITSRYIPDSWMVPEGNDMKLYSEFIDELNKRNIKHVFSTDPLLQWMLGYNGIDARYTSGKERINRFVNEVNTCYADSSCKTAIVGYKGMCNQMDETEGWHERVIFVNDKFFIFEWPEKRHLRKGGYIFDK